ncbi:hypothetical protein ACI2S3_16760 [Ralstonia nicotianae]|uniref:Uncharacterized protein n=1 Tax=Ralstonia nicotianae TaxID=3037696 RepID=A0ABX7ZYB3_9RALS|nr:MULTISPECIES: hypothetical protein [Ralstonia solanacearum species complex]MCK4125336.1 hypothetical protein [Ralstonia pseudosolanacearum]QUP59889.1 hypothetical protein GO999_15775 [Ralstonia nicotianae]
MRAKTGSATPALADRTVAHQIGLISVQMALGIAGWLDEGFGWLQVMASRRQAGCKVAVAKHMP